jgi:energy-coupling factor transporter ATP-binding protein EcfA2
MKSSLLSVRSVFSTNPTAKNKALTQELMRRLYAGQNVSLYGPLDTGKSTVLRLLADAIGSEKAVIHVDFVDEMDLFGRSTIHIALDRIGAEEIPERRAQAIRLLHELAAKPIVLLVDHLTAAVIPEDIQALTPAAMNWLSQQLLDLKLLAESGALSMCVAFDEISAEVNLINFMTTKLPNGRPALDRLGPILIYNHHELYCDHTRQEVLDFLSEVGIGPASEFASVISDQNIIGTVLREIDRILANRSKAH